MSERRKRKMKKIIIFQENTENLILFDDDSLDLVSYVKNLTKILESNKVCILETSSGIVAVKPSKLNSFSVVEVSNRFEDKKNDSCDIIKD